MKKIFLTLLIALTVIMAPKTSSAFILKAIEEAYNVIPLSPVINFGEDIAETGKLLNKTAMKVQKLAIQIKKDIITLKTSILDIMNKVDAVAHGNFGAIGLIIGLSDPNAEVKICGADMSQTKHSGLAKKLQEILLTYGVGEKEIVERNRRKFYLDNIYNIYAAVQVLKDNMSANGIIGTQIIETQSCCGEGQGELCGLPPIIEGSEENMTEKDVGNSEMLMYYGYALGTLENLIKTWEQVAALKAQLQAVETLLNIELKPDFSIEENEEISSIETPSPIYASAQTIYNQPLSFAQMIYKDNSDSGFDEIIEEEIHAVPNDGFSGTNIKFVEPKATLPDSPYNKRKEAMEKYSDLSDIENKISKALSIHSKIRDIDSYQKTAIEYNNLKDEYNKKLEIIEDSHKCGLGYVKQYFMDEDSVWSGKKLSGTAPAETEMTGEYEYTINNYDIRSGISGWAINAYEMAKAASANDVEGYITNLNQTKEKLKDYEKAEEQREAEDKDDYDIKERQSSEGVDVSDVNKKASANSEGSYEAEEAKGTVTNEDLEEETLVDDDLEGKEGKADLQSIEETKVTDKQDDYDSGKGISAEKSKETQKENRRANMIAWQIGALASEDLGINGGSEGPWGQTKDKLMVWQDAKIFYDQYLYRKYENIKKYLQRYIEADIIELFASLINNGQVMNINQTSYQKLWKDKYATAIAEIEKVLPSDSGKIKADPELISQRTQLETEINILDGQIKDLAKDVNDAYFGAETESYENNDRIAAESIDYLTPDEEKEKKAKNIDDVKQNVVLGSLEGKKKALDKKMELDNLKEEIKHQQKLLDQLNQQIEENIRTKQEELVKNAAINRNKINLIIAEFEKAVRGKMDKKGEYDIPKARKNKALLTLENVLKDKIQIDDSGEKNRLIRTIKNGINKQAGSIITELNKQIDEIVNNGLADMKYQLGDEMYLPDRTTSAKIVNLHKGIISRLQRVSVTATVSEMIGTTLETFTFPVTISSLIPGAAAISAVGGPLSSAAMATDLLTINTDADDNFFVGALPARRDFKAPYPMEDFSQPPVREIFHFDMVDFANIQPYNAKRFEQFDKNPTEKYQEMLAISRGDFLNYGGKVPELWKKMLGAYGPAFVQSEFQLQPALNQGCEAVALLRGGIMPCRVGNTSTVMDVLVEKSNKNKDGYKENEFYYKPNKPLEVDKYYVTRNDLDAKDLPKCILIEMGEKGPFLSYYEEYAKIEDGISEEDLPPLPYQCIASELGMILDADEDNNLYFKPFIYKLFNDNYYINEKKDHGKKKYKSESSALALSEQAQLSRNQVGDFLRQAESEKKMRQSLEEMKAKKDAQMMELKTLFEDKNNELFPVNDKPKFDENWDLTDDNIVNQIKNLLREAKNNLIGDENNGIGNDINNVLNNNKNNEGSATSDEEDSESQKLIEKRLSKLQDLVNYLNISGKKSSKDGKTCYQYKDIEDDRNKSVCGAFEYPSEYINITMDAVEEENWQEELNKQIGNAVADNDATTEYHEGKKKKAHEDDGNYRDLEEAYCANY